MNKVLNSQQIEFNIISDSTLTMVSSIEVPNVFTPNRDGFNDSFLTKGTNLKTIFGEIFKVGMGEQILEKKFQKELTFILLRQQGVMGKAI